MTLQPKSKILVRVMMIIIVTVLLFVSAITIWKLQQKKWVDKSFMTGVPCAIPCWQGITPGVTSREDALAILSASPLIKKGSMEEGGTASSGGIRWLWRASGRSGQSSIEWKDGIVKTSRLELAFDLTALEVIEKFGEPEAVSVVEGGVPEYWYWVVDLHYPAQGIDFRFRTPELSASFESDAQVEEVFLNRVMTMDEKIKEYSEGWPVPFPDDYFSEWKGYGDVSVLYDHGK